MSKIWIFNHYAHTPENGNITRHYDFAGILQERGHDVTIFTSGAVHNTDINECPNGELYVEKNIEGRHYVFVKTRTYESNGFQRVLNMTDFYFNLQKVSKHFTKPDIIYASSPHIFTLRAGLKVAKRLKVPCLCEVRDLWPEAIVEFSRFTRKNPGIKALYHLEKSIYKKADGLIFTQPKATDYLREQKWASEIDFSKIYNINNGVDLTQFAKKMKQYSIQDEDLDNKQAFKFVYTGAIRHVNNIGMILDAAKLVKNKNILFLLWGDGNEVSDLKQRIQNEKITNVKLKGYVYKQYVPYILSKSDVNLWHYLAKGKAMTKYGLSQNKSCEYFASGNPVLSTFAVGNEMVRECGAGLTLEETTPTAIAKAADEMAGLDTITYNKMKEASLLLAQRYDMSHLVDILEDTIKNTISRYKKA